MTFDLKGGTAVVTGSGKKSGIGYGIARKLAACGANVVIADLIGKETRQNDPAADNMDDMTGLARD
ncbi:MAG: SDR family NAD(P)-dependent oxidoreductase, partial [Desulfobacterales bacterium]|nr:SDR family NAD(P)-dependent oxidoreductase [Desulfobacterales bacterium]